MPEQPSSVDDALAAALQRQLDRHQPQQVPPFEGVLQRRRQRVRRRGAVAIGLAAALVVAVAVGVPALLGDDDGTARLATTPAPSPSPSTGIRFSLNFSVGFQQYPAIEEGVTACLQLPGVVVLSVDDSLPPFYDLLVDGDAHGDTTLRCLRALDGTVISRVTKVSVTPVPDVVGLPQQQAQDRLGAVGFTSGVRTEPADGSAPGIVLSQKPAAGQPRFPDTFVELVVAAPS